MKHAFFLVCLSVLFLACGTGNAHAGTWTVQPWTGDASTGIVSGETQWAYHFGSATTATVNGVSVPGYATAPTNGNPLIVAGQMELKRGEPGDLVTLALDTNRLTDLGGNASAVLGGSFFYGGLPSTNLTIKAASLQNGGQYVVSLYSVGWDPDARLVKFVSGTDELPIDQNLYGENFGLRADYAFTAGAGDQALRVDMNNALNRTFHIYAVALRKVAIHTNVALVSNNNPTLPGGSVTFTATVTPVSGGGIPTGNVLFKDGGTVLNNAVLNASGVATFTTSILTEGSHGMTATYEGSATYFDKVSPTLTQVVSKMNTVTALNSSANPVEPGSSVTFTATVIPITTGAGTPTGNVVFKDGETTLGTVALDGSGTASYSTSALTQGAHSITASYGGSSVYNSGVSAVFTQFITGSYTVTTTASAGPGSLAQTLADAVPGSFVVFEASLAGQVISMPASEIILNKDLVIDASALTGGITLQGGGSSRLFYIQAGSSVTFKNLTLTGGGGGGAANTGRGGAVLSAGTFTATDCVFRGNRGNLGGAVASGYSTQNSTLTVRRCQFTGNAATTGYGGALMNLCINGMTAQALVEDCTFTSNTASGGGAAVYNNGNTGISNLLLRASTLSGNSSLGGVVSGCVLNYSTLVTGTASMTVEQCTIAGNTAANPGGGLANSSADATTGAAAGPATLNVVHCTVVGNTAADGGGLVNQSPTAATTLTSSIIAGNTSTEGGRDVRRLSGSITSQGSNLIGSADHSLVTWQPTDITGTNTAPVDARLAALHRYGGLTATMPPLPGSPALDKAPAPAFITDQRGLPRVVDADQNGTATADIGAAESSLIQVDVAADELDTPAGAGDVSLREALRDAPEGSIITFAPGLSATTLTLTTALGSLQPTTSVMLDASSLPGGFTIRREAGGPRLFHVGARVGLGLRNIRLTGAATVLAEAGGAIFNLGGSVSLEKCTLTGHHSTAAGGAVYLSSGSLDITQCTISGNTSGTLTGGAIGVGSGTLNLQSSTLSGNGAAGAGSALFMTGGTATVSQCTFEGNASGAVKLSSNGTPVLSLSHCTLTRNASPDAGGGILIVGAAPVVSLHNTLIAGNTGSAGSPDISNLSNAVITRSGTNLIGKNDGAETAFAAGLPNAAGDHVGTVAAPVEPLLGPLADNGGPTQTCLPLAGSPAIDSASGTIHAVDQRGISRPRDGNGDYVFAADIGAVEIGGSAAIVVTTLADEADSPPGVNISLREAVAVSLSGVPITFAPALAGKTITLDAVNGEISIPRSTIVDATALPGGIIIDAGTGTNRHFYAGGGLTLELRGLTFTGGGGTGTFSSGFGGAIVSLSALTLQDCTFRDNQAINSGGAVAAVTSFRATRCTFHDNRASNQGGALYLQGAASVLDNCTLTRNHAEGAGHGGAIHAQSTTALTLLTLTHCTVTGNTSANSNGGISMTSQAGDMLTLNSTILAGNLGQDLRLFNVAPALVSGGGNVLGSDPFLAYYNQPTDTRNVTAPQVGLAELGRYGGLTDTMPPLPGSPALDRATDSSAIKDQRGFVRSLDGNFDSSLTSDSGAVESAVVQVTTSNDENNTPAGTQVSLREAVRDAPDGAVIITSPLTNTWFINSQELVISRPVVIASSSLSSFQGVNGAGIVRMLHIAPGARVHLNRLTFSGGGGAGAALSGKGGAILNQGRLSMTTCNLTGATADFGGTIANGMSATPAWLKMSRCTISASTATAQGGAIYNAVSSGGTAVVEMNNTVIRNNTATRQGGAVANVGGNGTTTFTAEHCTIMRNTSQSSGGGVFTSTESATTWLTSCLIAENTATSGGPDVQTTGSLFSGGTNLIGIAEGGTIWAGSDLTGTAAVPLDPRTGSDIGSFQLKPGSPAVDAAAITYRHILDRLDNPRVIDGDLNGSAQPDIGAYEAAAILITTAEDEFNTPSGASVSLREAMRDASAIFSTHLRLDPALSGQTLTLDPGLGQISNTKTLYLDASALPGGFTIDSGSGASRLFQNSGALHLRGLRLTGGEISGDGGAILSSGTLVLEDCTLSGHTATGQGGALYSSGRLRVKRCTFTGNSATSHGGAFALTGGADIMLENSAFTDNASAASGGAVYIFNGNSSNNRIAQCTIAGNRSAQRGGGVLVTNSSLSVLHCTITQNRAATQRGGGLLMEASSNYRQTLQNTIITDNHAPALPDVAVDNYNPTWPLSAGGNLIGQNAGAPPLFPAGLPNAAGDYVGSETAPLKGLLAPCGIYGGTTATCPPLPGSLALDKAVPTTTLYLTYLATVETGTLSTDQRGFARSVDGDLSGSALPDIGAAESVVVRVDVADDELDTPAGTNDVSLREAVRDAPEGAVISFAPALAAQPLTLGGAGSITPGRSLIISGSISGSPDTKVTLSPAAGDRVFFLPQGLSLGLTHLRLSGATRSGGGGVIESNGRLALADCVLTGNSASGDGGAIISIASGLPASLSISRCRIDDNHSGDGGGAIGIINPSAESRHELLIEDSVLIDNHSAHRGGAVQVFVNGGISRSFIRRCTLASNTSGFDGGAVINWALAAGSTADMTLESCTLAYNTALNAKAGALRNVTGSGTARTTLHQCTLAENESGPGGGAISNESGTTGGLSNLALIRSTVTANSSQGPGGGLENIASGGGTAVAQLDGSIIAGNTAPSGADVIQRMDATVTTLGTNLIGNTDGSQVNWQETDITGTAAAPRSPTLADLGSYGGPTQTMPPLLGSPARNPASGATTATGLADQRGGARLIGTSVDIGAVEAGDADAPGTIAFGAPIIRVQENVGELLVPVFRTGGSMGTVDVRIATSTGSGLGFATATADFTPIFGDVLNFGPGETVEYMPVTIVSDPKVKEPHEDFTLTLSSITGGASLGAQSTTTVRILDFVDATAPSLSLTAPKANEVVTSASVTLIGTAKDDKGLLAVQVQLNGGAWVDATLTGTPQLCNFSLALTAVPGLNTLNLRAVDEKGKISSITKRNFTYKVSSTLTVTINGPANSGTVSKGFTPSSTRDVGLTYKISATPKKGFLFTGWSATPHWAITNDQISQPTLSFVMQPGLTLTARFATIANIVNGSGGTYQGLVTPSGSPSNANTGFFTLTVTSTTGAVSGSLRIDGSTIPFSGQTIYSELVFKPALTRGLIVQRKGKTGLFFSVNIFTDTARLYLTHANDPNGPPIATGAARHCPYTSKSKVPTTLVSGSSQRFNLILPSVPEQAGAATYPPGTGIGSLTLGSDGSAKVAGVLADNTTFTSSTLLNDQHTAPLFASLYGNLGHIAGTLNVMPPATPGYDAYGVNLYWNRPAQPKVQWYPLGWPKSLFVDLVGSKYLIPATSASQSVIPGLGPVDLTNTVGNATLTFMDGLLSSTRNYAVNITPKDAVTLLPLKTKDFTLKLTKASGEISGTFTHTDGKKPAFKATTIQKPGDYQGTYGFFMSVPPNKTSTTNQAGSVMLLPNP